MKERGVGAGMPQCLPGFAEGDFFGGGLTKMASRDHFLLFSRLLKQIQVLHLLTGG